MTQEIRAIVAYPFSPSEDLDAWAKSIAWRCGGEFVCAGVGRSRELFFRFQFPDYIGTFITEIEANPGCSVRIGKASIAAG